MQLVIGGFGFVGSNTVRALLELDQECLLIQHSKGHMPDFLAEQVGRRVFVEPADGLDLASLRALGAKYKITGIVQFATGGMPARRAEALDFAEDIHGTVSGIANAIQLATEWGVKRVMLASAPVVYNGAQRLPWREDEPLSMTATFPMEAAKKCGEILASYLGLQCGVECVEVRLASMYGPNYDPTRSSLAGRLVHAAVTGKDPHLANLRFGSIHAEDGGDNCYIKDAARGMALLQVADKLNHRLYNVSSGMPTTNQEIVDAVKSAIPGFRVELPAGHMPGLPEAAWYFDITRLRQDTAFEPQYSLEQGISEYIEWLRAGHVK